VINDWNGFGQRTTASGTVKLNNVEVDPALIFDERIIDTPNIAVRILSYYKLRLMSVLPKQLLMTLCPAFVKPDQLSMQV
jgi:hypothetical protein